MPPPFSCRFWVHCLQSHALLLQSIDTPFRFCFVAKLFDVPGDLRGKRRKDKRKKPWRPLGNRVCQQMDDPMSLWRMA